MAIRIQFAIDTHRQLPYNGSSLEENEMRLWKKENDEFGPFIAEGCGDEVMMGRVSVLV